MLMVSGWSSGGSSATPPSCQRSTPLGIGHVCASRNRDDDCRGATVDGAHVDMHWMECSSCRAVVVLNFDGNICSLGQRCPDLAQHINRLPRPNASEGEHQPFQG